MTNNSLHKLIDIFSNRSVKEKPESFISKGIISKHIIKVKLDVIEFQGLDTDHYILADFYFLKNKYNQIVGVVYDMGFDLHSYVLPKYRNMGYMSNLLKNELLPYLLYYKSKINITIVQQSKFTEYSTSLVEKLGFTEIEDSLFTDMYGTSFKAYTVNDDKYEDQIFNKMF